MIYRFSIVIAMDAFAIVIPRDVRGHVMHMHPLVLPN